METTIQGLVVSGLGFQVQALNPKERICRRRVTGICKVLDRAHDRRSSQNPKL